jgi:hypothetical protein
MDALLTRFRQVEEALDQHTVQAYNWEEGVIQGKKDFMKDLIISVLLAGEKLYEQYTSNPDYQINPGMPAAPAFPNFAGPPAAASAAAAPPPQQEGRGRWRKGIPPPKPGKGK